MGGDVTWHSADIDKPPQGDRYYVALDLLYGGGRYVRTADWYEVQRRWEDECGDDVTLLVTHWAHIVYPEPPEEA